MNKFFDNDDIKFFKITGATAIVVVTLSFLVL